MTERDIFLTALDQPDPAARAAFVARACAADSALRRRVEELLASHDAAGSFLAVPAVPPPDPDHADTQAFAPGASRPAGGPDGDDVLAVLAAPGRPDSLGRIGHYEVLQVLGRGGFGVVFRAFDDVLERVVAVKVLAPQVAATSPARKRFLREARAYAAVRHENVVQVHEIGETPLPYLVMEFIPGETLQQRLDRTGPVDPAEVVRVGRQIAEGLAAAHATDLIHRDIKPGNVLIEGGNLRVKITDYGLARAADDASQTQSGVIAGTPMYMAPEQARGERTDHRADLFSLGSVLYQMVTGRPPFRASNTPAVLKRVADDTPRPIRGIIPEAPRWLCAIIERLHAKHPADRFQSARELADVLGDCEARLKASASAGDFPRLRSAVPAARRRRAVGGGVAALLLAAAGVYALTRPGPPPVDGHAPPPVAPPPVAPPANWQNWPSDAPPPAVAPFDAPAARRHQEAWATYLGVPTDFTNGVGMKFVLVPPGEFLMGCPPDEVEAVMRSGVVRLSMFEERLRSQTPQRPVTLTRPLYVGAHEVTQGQYGMVAEKNPSFHAPAGAGKDRVVGRITSTFPVEYVTWTDAVEFCNRLSRKEDRPPAYDRTDGGGLPRGDAGYRLPTEAEWEFAARAGTVTRYWFGDADADLDRHEWHAGNSGFVTHAVGALRPNPFGLYDTAGNVREWVQDWSDLASYRTNPGRPVTDPTGPGASPTRERRLRGGMYSADPYQCRSAARDVSVPENTNGDLGFRVVLSVEAVKPARRLAAPTDAEVRRVAALPAAEQVEEVRKELKRRNPDFDGVLTHAADAGVVVGLEFHTNAVSDIAPVRLLPGLKSLACTGIDRAGRLTDLSPLKGSALTSLDANGNPQLADLSPLAGLPLTSLFVQHTQVRDLAPLAGTRLRHLNASYTQVADLGPLRGMPLDSLYLDDTRVTDLTPLRGLPLRIVNLRNVTVSADRDVPVLRSLPHLESINGDPAAEFLR